MTPTKRRGKQPKKEVVSVELVPPDDVRDIAVPTNTVLDEIRARRRDPRERLRDVFSQWRSGQMVATKETYQRDLVDFARFYGVPERRDAKGRILMEAMAERVSEEFLGLPEDDAVQVFIAYRQHLMTIKRAPATINRRMSALYSLTRSARSGKLIEWRLPPGEDVYLRVKLSRDVSGPGPEVYRRIIASIDESSSSGGIWITKARALRDIVMLRLLHDLGLRRIEVLRLNLDDAIGFRGEPGGQRLAVWGKGEDETDKMEIPLTNGSTITALARWIACRGVGHHGSDGQNPLFVSFSNRAKGERLSLRSLNWIVRERAIEAGYFKEGCKKREAGKWCSCCGKLPPEKIGGKPRSISPHGFRHTSITTLMGASGKDLAKVQAFSRHKTITMLGRYDDAKIERAGDAQAILAQATEPPVVRSKKKAKTKGRKR